VALQCAGGRAIVSGGDGSSNISVFDLVKSQETAMAASNGIYPDPPTTLSVERKARQRSLASQWPAEGSTADASSRPTLTGLLSQTDVAMCVRTVRCSGMLVACSGSTGSCTILRAATA
jgi:hypothetical protein